MMDQFVVTNGGLILCVCHTWRVKTFVKYLK